MEYLSGKADGNSLDMWSLRVRMIGRHEPVCGRLEVVGIKSRGRKTRGNFMKQDLDLLGFEMRVGIVKSLICGGG